MMIDYMDITDYENFEDMEFDNEDIYNELTSTEDLGNFEDHKPCDECGDPRGVYTIDPDSETTYGEEIHIYLCRHCSDQLFYL